jgi:hypothetical protein
LSKTTKHYWYGDSSPWTDQQFDRRHDFGGPLTESAPRAAILDGENPPQLLSSHGPLHWAIEIGDG